jgi:hypothetical protein
MTDDDLAAQFDALRAAADEVFVSERRRQPPRPYTTVWHELHQALLASPSAPDGSPDPTRYSLAFTDDDGPYELTKLAAEIRADLAGDRARGEHLPEHPPRDVRLTQLRAMVISSLLRELEARLAQGPAAGTDEAGSDLAEIAAERATRLINMTSAGAQQ